MMTCAFLVIAVAVPSVHAAEATTNSLSPTARVFQAVRLGDLPMLRAAIADGGDVNGREAGDLPPLMAVLRTAPGPLNDARRQCVVCLLENGADVDPKDDAQRTPLIHAARLGDFETVKVLVAGEAYVKARDGFHKTALFYAVDAGRRDIVLYLASHGDLVSLTIKERKLLGKN